ncbi:MAG: sulfate ABC transporter permease subunit CysT [Veillonella sp.]|uniref:sulfate ABC transporter permease subunit CysT n=1 Tax=Veillonella sp. TaxID=1926307 RepID=UPI0025D8C07F|nr:sulfate ABC transporter permease subunit CysT [Veillonella sp.]MBE6080731.1 sulfate ABC transporter permease subunit CysT [Veillonella sp.]
MNEQNQTNEINQTTNSITAVEHKRTVPVLPDSPKKKGSGKKAKTPRLLPGFGLTMGVTLTILSIIVILPIGTVLGFALQIPPAEFVKAISKPVVWHAFATSIMTAFAAASINLVFGTLLAWILVRYTFPGRRIIDSLIELPFALPTAVAGITLSKLYSETGLLGSALVKLGVSIVYTKIGIIIALVFVGIPFVVRSVEPVLAKLDGSYEEAGAVLGASNFTIFRRIILPEILPAGLAGFALAFARGLGEYGSVIYISGNSAKAQTQVVSYVIMQKLNYVDYEGATAMALVLLVLAFLILLSVNLMQLRQARRLGGR